MHFTEILCSYNDISTNVMDTVACCTMQHVILPLNYYDEMSAQMHKSFASYVPFLWSDQGMLKSKGSSCHIDKQYSGQWKGNA